VHAAKGWQALFEAIRWRVGMLDIAMIVMVVAMFALLLGYAPLCDKLT
jgi:hypothetical protein